MSSNALLAQVTLTARLRRFSQVDAVEAPCSDLSPRGMFVQAADPDPAGTLLWIECQPSDGSGTISAVAKVVWRREREVGGLPPGMGVRFLRLKTGSAEVIHSVLKKAGSATLGRARAIGPDFTVAPEYDEWLESEVRQRPAEDESEVRYRPAEDESEVRYRPDEDESEVRYRPAEDESRARQRRAEDESGARPIERASDEARQPEQPEVSGPQGREAHRDDSVSEATGREPQVAAASQVSAPQTVVAPKAPPATSPGQALQGMLQARLRPFGGTVATAPGGLAQTPQTPSTMDTAGKRAAYVPARPEAGDISGLDVPLRGGMVWAPWIGGFALLGLVLGVLGLGLRSWSDPKDIASPTSEPFRPAGEELSGRTPSASTTARRAGTTRLPQPSPQAQPGAAASAPAAAATPAAAADSRSMDEPKPPAAVASHALAATPSHRSVAARSRRSASSGGTARARAAESRKGDEEEESSGGRGTRLQRAKRCLARGDNRCVVRVLEGRARSAQELGLLIETYSWLGKTRQARRNMKLYVKRYPSAPGVRRYQKILREGR